MGSFTTNASKTIMDALFPTSTSSHVPANSTSSTDMTVYKIYNQGYGANTGVPYVGIYCATTGAVKHRIDLIVGSNTAGNTSPGSGVLTDANFAGDTLTTTGSPTAGTLYFPYGTSTPNYYPGYTGVLQGDLTITNNLWTGWTLTTTSAKGQAANNAQIAFPAMTAGVANSGVTAWGFCISAATATSSACASNTTLRSVTANANPIILAYGDLSQSRSISGGDTPVFTSGSIVITLE